MLLFLIVDLMVVGAIGIAVASVVSVVSDCGEDVVILAVVWSLLLVCGAAYAALHRTRSFQTYSRKVYVRSSQKCNERA